MLELKRHGFKYFQISESAAACVRVAQCGWQDDYYLHYHTGRGERKRKERKHSAVKQTRTHTPTPIGYVCFFSTPTGRRAGARTQNITINFTDLSSEQRHNTDILYYSTL